MPTLTAALLVNSRSRKGRRSCKRIQTSCRMHGITVQQTVQFNKHDSLHDSVRACLAKKPQLLIVAGGDGTISGVVGKLANIDIVVGLVPLGTTNNIARSLHIPFSIDAAVQRIATGKPKTIDLAQAGDHTFVNVLSIGVAARIADTITDHSKKYLGRAAYAYAGVRAVLARKAFTVTIYSPLTKTTQTLHTRQVIVANGRFHAGTKVANDATLSDGRFIVFTLGGRNLLSFVWRTARYFFGQRRRSHQISEVIASKVTISCSPAQPIECDGERLGMTPVTITMLPKAVRIIC